jgi:hypothetical protein
MERTNHIIEDMLRACALKYGKSWDKSLPYVEFSYNNYMDDNVETLCSGVKFEKVKYLV